MSTKESLLEMAKYIRLLQLPQALVQKMSYHREERRLQVMQITLTILLVQLESYLADSQFQGLLEIPRQNLNFVAATLMWLFANQIFTPSK